MRGVGSRTRGTNIDALFEPQSVVVIGASTNLERVSGRPLGFLRDWKFAGALAVVNPRRESVLGYQSFPEVTDVPFVPDLAIVCVPAESVLGALRQCASHGVRAAIVFAAGFGELAGGCEDEVRIRELAEETGMAVCGPNCLGVISVDDLLPATFSTVLSEAELRSGDVAMVMQSGALGIYLYAEATRRGVGFSRWVSTGNECSLALGDYIAWLADDPRTRVICAYVEGIRDGDSFRAALAAARGAGKPVIVLKGGRSQPGAQGVTSHTGAIAGDATVFSGVLAAAGACEVEDATELLDVASLARRSPELDSDRGVAIATTSGGGGILASDWLTRCGLRQATLSVETVDAVERVIPAFGRAENPVDFTGNLMNDPDMVREVIDALARDGDVGAIVVFVGVGGRTADLVVDAILRASVPESCGLAVVWIGAAPAIRTRLGEGGIPLFSDVGPCIRALARLWSTAGTPHSSERLVAAIEPEADDVATAILLEYEVKRDLADAGLPVPAGQLVVGGELDDLDPHTLYAVKGQARGVVHKAARGLVRLDCPAGEVSAACAELVEGAMSQGLELDGVLVEEMAPPGLELLVSARKDTTFGWTLFVGAGGADVEAQRDIVARPCPLGAGAAGAALDSLVVSQAFESGPSSGREHAIDLLVEFSRIVEALPAGISELELNPVIVTPERATIVDAVALVECPERVSRT